jgi:hypothetical protein
MPATKLFILRLISTAIPSLRAAMGNGIQSKMKSGMMSSSAQGLAWVSGPSHVGAAFSVI